MNRKLLYFAISLLSLLTMAAACSGKDGSSSSRETGAVDAAPEASLLRLVDREGYTLAEILSPSDTSKVLEKYILVADGAQLPDDAPDDGRVIRTPVKSAVIYSSVVAAALEELGYEDMIKGVVDAEYFQQKSVTDGLADGSVKDLGSPSSPDMEAIIAMRPQAVILNLYDGMSVPDFTKTGAATVKLLDNREDSPLGRAEWIKFIGALAGRRAAADSIFNAVANRYRRVLAESKNIARRPTLMVENIYEGTWYMPGGESYQARMLADAGADYLWSDDKRTGSLNLSFEQVIAKARNADLWLLKLFGVELDRKKLLEMDERYRYFSAVEKGNVYYVNTMKNNIFDLGSYHPDLILEEYNKIFSAVADGKEPEGLRFFQRMR